MTFGVFNKTTHSDFPAAAAPPTPGQLFYCKYTGDKGTCVLGSEGWTPKKSDCDATCNLPPT